jgi:hypothetical protein
MADNLNGSGNGGNGGNGGNISPLLETYPAAEAEHIPSAPYPPGLGFSGGGGGGAEGGGGRAGAENFGVRFTNGYRPGNENANLSKPLPSGGAYAHPFYRDPRKLGYSHLSPAEFTELTTPLQPYNRKRGKKTSREAIQLERFFQLVAHQQSSQEEAYAPIPPGATSANIALLRAQEQHEQALLNVNTYEPNHARYGYMRGFPGAQERTVALWSGTPFTPRGAAVQQEEEEENAAAGGGGGSEETTRKSRRKKHKSRKN